MSRHLSLLQLKGIDKMGNCMLPGDGELASFSASGCSSEVDRILDFMPAKDLGDLKMLLTLMGLLPAFVISLFLGFLERTPSWGAWAAPLRFVRIGVRGLIMTLYYSHPQAHKVLGYQVGVYVDDLRSGPGANKRRGQTGAVRGDPADATAVGAGGRGLTLTAGSELSRGAHLDRSEPALGVSGESVEHHGVPRPRAIPIGDEQCVAS